MQDFASAGALVDEMSDLRGYLSRGGKLLITTDSYNRTPNLDACWQSLAFPARRVWWWRGTAVIL